MHRHHGSRSPTGRDSGDFFGAARRPVEGSEMPTRDLTLAMVGSGGDGVVTMGEMMAQAGARDGLNVIKVEAYGPQIRGGESSCTLRMSAEPISAQGDAVDVLVVFNWADFGRFKGEVVPKADAVILYEATDPTPARRGEDPDRDERDLDPGPVRRARHEGDRDEGREEHRDARHPRRALRASRRSRSGRPSSSSSARRRRASSRRTSRASPPGASSPGPSASTSRPGSSSTPSPRPSSS